MGKTFDDLSLKKLISLIKGDINKKQNKIEATGILQAQADGTIAGLETLDAELVDLADVATTGSYNDLKDKPTIPTVPTAEITANTNARHAHSNKDVLDSITGIVDMDHINNPVNQSDLVPYNVAQAVSGMIIEQIPTTANYKFTISGFTSANPSESELVSDKSYSEVLYAAQMGCVIVPILLYTDNYSVILNPISINENQMVFQWIIDNEHYLFTWDSSGVLFLETLEYARKTNLATVATSGSYNDLTNKPTIGNGEISISYRNSSGGTTSSRFNLNDTTAHKIDIYTPTKLSEFTNDTNYATKTEVSNATAGLTGAMHFIGSSTTAITDHGTQQPTVNGTKITSFNAGDVVLYNHLEFVWDGAKWEKLGDEGSYVLKTQKINGKALSGDITLEAADVGALPISTDYVDGQTYQTEIAGIKNSIPAAANNGTLTIQRNGTQIGTFSADQETNSAVNVLVPTAVSELDNDSDYATTSDVSSAITNAIDKIPSPGAGVLTIQKNGNNVGTFSANASTNATVNIAVPVNTSDLTNDTEMRVNITKSGSTYSSDKTFQEIRDALTNNMFVYAVYNNCTYNITNIVPQPSSIAFVNVDFNNILTSIIINGNGITVNQKTLQPISGRVSTINSLSDDSHYPSAKAVYDYVQSAMPTTSIITWSET